MIRQQGVILLLAVLGSGCVTVTGVERGPRLETRTLDTYERGRRETAHIENGRASLRVAQERCTVSRAVFRELEVQRVKHPSYGRLFGGLGMASLGALFAGIGYANFDAGTLALTGTDYLGALGASLTLVGVMMAATSGQEAPTETRKVPLDSTQFEDSTRCKDASHVLRGPTPWTVMFGPQKRSGTTGPDGQLVLAPEVRALLEQAPADRVEARLARGEKLALNVALGKADPVVHPVSSADVTETQWERWSANTRNTLNELGRLRFDACREAMPSHRTVAECLWRPEVHASKVVPFEGTLERTESGDYGALHELQGTKGERFSYRLLLPGEDVDWLVQLVDLQTGEVVAEQFSESALRLDVSAVFPRTSDYGLVLNAEHPGSFRSFFTVKR